MHCSLYPQNLPLSYSIAPLQHACCSCSSKHILLPPTLVLGCFTFPLPAHCSSTRLHELPACGDLIQSFQSPTCRCPLAITQRYIRCSANEETLACAQVTKLASSCARMRSESPVVRPPEVCTKSTWQPCTKGVSHCACSFTHGEMLREGWQNIRM